MYTIGLTGGIGSGKTTVARIFESKGIPVYYADQEAKRLMYKSTSLKSDLKNLLGHEAYHSNGRPNRPFIASKVFSDKSLLKSINALIHPAVKNDFLEWAEVQKSPYVIEESAIIFEIKGQAHFDKIVIVTAEIDIRIDRIMKRDKTTRKAILDRMNNQLSDEIKIPLADYVITNNGEDNLEKQVHNIHKQLINKKK